MAASGPPPLSTLSSVAVDGVGSANLRLILASLKHYISACHLPESPLEPANISLLVASGTLLGIRVCAIEALVLADLRMEGMPRRVLPSIPLTFDIAPRRRFSSHEPVEAAEFTRSLLASTRIRAVLRRIDEAGTGVFDLPLMPMLAARSACRLSGFVRRIFSCMGRYDGRNRRSS